MATTALGGVVNIGHRNMHDSVKMLEEEVEYGRLEAHAETSMESGYGPQSNSPGVLMTAVGRSIKSEASPASPDSTMSSSSSSLGPSEDSHVSVLRRGPSAAPPPFVPFTAAPPRISTGSSGGLRIHHQHHQPASVARRNARERNRVKQVNNGFATLRQHIPPALIAAAAAERAASPHPEKPTASGRSGGSNSAASKKMSKVETLRCAVEYIRSLQEMLREADGGSPRECDEQEFSGGAGEVCEGLGPESTRGPSPESSMVRCSPASSPVSSSADSSFLPASPPPPPSTAPGTTPLVEDGARHYLPLQPVQPFEYIDIDAYTRLQGYEGAVAASAGGVLQFYHHERIKREEEDMESAPMMLEPHPATGSPPPHGYSTSATAYLAMAPGPHALLQRQPGDEVDMVTEGDVTGMMTWWTEEPQC